METIVMSNLITQNNSTIQWKCFIQLCAFESYVKLAVSSYTVSWTFGLSESNARSESTAGSELYIRIMTNVLLEANLLLAVSSPFAEYTAECESTAGS